MGIRVNHKAETVFYLYGVSQAPVSKRKMAGVHGSAAIETVDCDGLVSWVSRVSGAEFGEGLSKNMENLDWLAVATTQHQRVVAAIAESNEILPARFGTVFLTQSSLRQHVQSRREVLESDFKRIRGGEEWGIKVFVLPPKASERRQPVRSGKEYLQAKSTLLEVRKPKRRDEEIARLAKELEGLSVAIAEGGKISSGRRDLQYQVSVLVKRSDRRKLENLLRKFSREWQGSKQIEATGPWPPYSFVSRSPAVSVG